MILLNDFIYVIFLGGVFVFFMSAPQVLAMLISFEVISLSIFLKIYYLSLSSSERERFTIFVFLSVIVIETTLGLSLIIVMRRVRGKIFVSNRSTSI